MLLDRFFNPRSAAVIGASSTPGKSGNICLGNMTRMGFSGKIFPINPNANDEILGLRVYGSVSQCPEVPELSVIVVPRPAVPDCLEQAGRAGCKNAIIASGGFADTDDQAGLELDEAIMKIAQTHGIRIMGPNSIGVIDTRSGFITSITMNTPLPVGSVSFFGQTGLFASGHSRRISKTEFMGVNKIACLGNKSDLDECDFFSYLAQDATTKTIGCYIEGVKDGRRFFEIARKAAARKPLIVLKGGVGATGAKAAAGHTGAMATNQAIFEGAMDQARAVNARNLDDFFSLLTGFSHGPAPKGNRVGLISITGAGCVQGADAADRYGLSLPELSEKTIESIRGVCPSWAPVRNPVDIWSAIEQKGVEESYRRIGSAVARDESVDAIGLIITLFPGSIFDPSRVIREICKAASDKPVFTVLIAGGPEENTDWIRSAHRAGASTFSDVDHALRVLSARVEDAKHRIV